MYRYGHYKYTKIAHRLWVVSNFGDCTALFQARSTRFEHEIDWAKGFCLSLPKVLCANAKPSHVPTREIPIGLFFLLFLTHMRRLSTRQAMVIVLSWLWGGRNTHTYACEISRRGDTRGALPSPRVSSKFRARVFISSAPQLPSPKSQGALTSKSAWHTVHAKLTNHELSTRGKLSFPTS